MPIVVLTARETPAEKVQVLALGANDYVLKPFHSRELIARLQVQLRRTPPAVVVCGELSLYPQEGKVTFQNRHLHLTPTEFKILLRLAGQPGRIFSHDELRAAVREGPPRGSNLMNVHVRHIRQKLQSEGAPGLVRTVRGEGYALRETG